MPLGMVARVGDTISGMVSRVEGATMFKHGVALFPGGSGIPRLREEGGRVRKDKDGNCLTRSRNGGLDG